MTFAAKLARDSIGINENRALTAAKSADSARGARHRRAGRLITVALELGCATSSTKVVRTAVFNVNWTVRTILAQAG